MNKLVVISGCSGGGKTTLISELGKRGYSVVSEPGRRIVYQEQQHNGTSVPWINPEEFLKRVIHTSLSDLKQWSTSSDWVFFDRGLIDAARGLAQLTDTPIEHYLRNAPKFNRTVFLTPPWPEIYVTDEQRKHSLADAQEEYQRLLRTYPQLGYNLRVLDKTSTKERTDAILQHLQII